MQDAQGNEQARQLFQQLRQMNEQWVQQIHRHFAQRLIGQQGQQRS